MQFSTAFFLVRTDCIRGFLDDIPKISKILELRESMQCEDKDPTLYLLALARRGCWIIYRILISIPDCHSAFLRTLRLSSSISIVSPALNNMAFNCLLTCWKPQCLLKISAGLIQKHSSVGCLQEWRRPVEAEESCWNIQLTIWDTNGYLRDYPTSSSSQS